VDELIVAVGIGPGATSALTTEAAEALRRAEVVIGYRPYIDMVADAISPGAEVEASGMRQEVDRCRRALALHHAGKSVVVVSSGDAGVYGMAGLLMELDPNTDIEVVPGITAAQAAAARLGAPLMNDFAVLSLSNLLTPTDEVLARARAAAASGLVTCLYNPTSRRRRPLFEQVVGIFREHRPSETPVGWVRNAYRPDEEVHLTTLEALGEEPVDMWSVVIVGSERTEILGGRMVTRRGYADRYDVDGAGEGADVDGAGERADADVAEPAGAPEPLPHDVPVGAPTPNAGLSERRIYMLGGTSYARRLAVDLEDAGYSVRLSVATPLGEAEVERVPSGGIHRGRLGSPALAREIESFGARVLIDSTHPYAVEASKAAQKAAAAAGVTLIRAARAEWTPTGEGEPVRFFDSTEELAHELLHSCRRAFFTVGAKGLQDFAGKGLDMAARVLPTPESVQAALDAGVMPEHLVAAYPPYDEAFTLACLRRHGCDVIVSKESGREGGLDEKLAAARAAGAELFILGRPEESGPVFNTLDPLLTRLEELWPAS
jgi:precorrin-6x reductase